MATSALEHLRTIQRELATRRTEEVPEGWLTSAQWAKEANLARPTVEAILADGAAAGLIERKQFRIVVGSQTRKVWHYRKAS